MTFVLGLIVARGGSKGVPRKNLRQLGGKPLVVWSIEAALAAQSLSRVVVSTDDEEIGRVAEEAGADVPFRRPAELATDSAPDLPVLRHALAELDPRPDVVVWLRPTSPLREPADIDAAVHLLLSTGADCVRSVCEVEHHPFWMYRIQEGRLLPFLPDVDAARFSRRQALPPAFRANGAVDVIRASAVPADGAAFEAGDVRAYVMPQARSVDIDTEHDFRVAEALVERGLQ